MISAIKRTATIPAITIVIRAAATPLCDLAIESIPVRELLHALPAQLQLAR